MGKLKAIIIVTLIVLVSLVFGFFQIQNDHDIMVDLLYKPDMIEMSVGRFAMAFFGSGLLIGIALCVTTCLLMGIELKSARRDAHKLSKQLDKLRERTAKDSG